MAPTTTLVERLEKEEEAIAEAIAEDTAKLDDEMGDRPFGTKARPAEMRAAKFLPTWFVYGQAEPPVSWEYWDGKLGLKPDLDTGETDADAGPASAGAFSRDMYVLAQRYPLVLAEGLVEEPQLLADYQMLRAAGLHLGHIKPPLSDYMAALDIPKGEKIPLAATPPDPTQPSQSAAPPPMPEAQMPQQGMPMAAPMMGGPNG